MSHRAQEDIAKDTHALWQELALTNKLLRAYFLYVAEAAIAGIDVAREETGLEWTTEEMRKAAQRLKDRVE